MRSVTTQAASSFNFISFALEECRLEINDKVQGALIAEWLGNGEPAEWYVAITIAAPKYYKSENRFHCGLACNISLSIPSKQKTLFGDEGSSSKLLVLKARIGGIFASNGEMPQPDAERLAKVQAPAILLPYLRGAMATLLANGGYGSVILPLVNINKLAEQAFQGKSIEVIE